MIGNPKLHFLRQLFVKFGLLSSDQLSTAVSGLMGRSQLYSYLKEMRESEEVVSWRRSETEPTLYLARQELLAKAIGKKREDTVPISEKVHELEHRLRCNDLLLNLCRYSSVSGIVLEHEILRFDFTTPLQKRRPDGLIQITRPEQEPFELAVELELQRKDSHRVGVILDEYESAYRRHPGSRFGLLLVVPDRAVRSMYERAIESRTDLFKDRLLLSSSIDLTDVPEGKLGPSYSHLWENPTKSWTRFRTQSGEKPLYEPYKGLIERHKELGRRRPKGQNEQANRV